MELFEFLLQVGVGVLAVTILLGGVVFLEDYLTYVSLQRRLKKEREVEE